MMTRKTRRVLMVGAALLLAAGNLWWFTREHKQPEPDFVLGATLEHVSVPADALPSLPRYDAATGTWSERGQPIRAIGGLVRPYHGGDVVTGGKPKSFLAIAIGASVGPDEIRPIFLDLARAGICDVAVVQDGMTPGPRGDISVVIDHIVSVRDGAGKTVKCDGAQSAAAPSSASR